MEDNLENLELRMYSLVLYQLSGIQAGIQAGHATVRYGVKYDYCSQYKMWARNWETVIVLSGGSSITLNERIKELDDAGIKYSAFSEIDLYGGITAVSFIVDERVFNKEKYPDFNKDAFDPNDISYNYEISYAYDIWYRKIGGQNVWLREWLNTNRFKFAG